MVGEGSITASKWRAQHPLDFQVIDCDVHQTVRDLSDLLPYLSRLYREHVTDQGFLLPSSGYFNVPRRAMRADMVEGRDADANCWSYDVLRDEYLDVWNIGCVLLTGAVLNAVSVIPDPDYAAALCRAFNEWTLDNWIARDSRLRMAMAIATSDPGLAVREIERIGENRSVVGVMLFSGARMPYGNRSYHPIWEACQRYQLVACVHPGAEGAGMAGPPTGVGYPTYYIETRAARPQMAMAHTASLIAEGVFERFPKLKFVFLEMDQFWVPGLLAKMDADWKSLREQTPWVKDLPSEYFWRHIRIGSQPILESPGLEDLLSGMHAEQTLIYCSDWPHFDWDDPATLYKKLPEHLRRRVFSDNPRELLRG
jgi:predicted TIM-barrel fold metal-dependent hydrolase